MNLCMVLPLRLPQRFAENVEEPALWEPEYKESPGQNCGITKL